MSRALTACEGAVLVVDSTQGVQAQTVANAYLAVENDLELIPVVNKIDLPAADPDGVAMEVEQVLGLAAEDSIYVSAKSGKGIPELLDAICEKLPDPPPATTDRLRALIFDSNYDDYRGVVVFVRVFDGSISVGDTSMRNVEVDDHGGGSSRLRLLRKHATLRLLPGKRISRHFPLCDSDM